MKILLKKITILLIDCLLIIAILFGCSSENKKVDSDEIIIMAPLNGISEPDKDNDIEERIQDLTGENINIIWIPKESYKQKSMMMIAAGEFPDIQVVEDETEDIVKAVEQGGFWNIGPYLKDYPNLCNEDQSILENSSFNGEIYGIYRYRNTIDNTIVLRKDWMEKLALKNPNTIDEFEELLKEITDNDPDGNGIKDTYGLGFSGADYNVFNSVIDQVATWFGASNKWNVENEVLTPSFMTPEYKKALDYIKNLYDEGLIDPEFYLTNASDVQKNFIDNKYGAVIVSQANAMKLQSEISEKYLDNDNILTAIARLKGSNEGKTFSSDGYSGLLMFPKKAIKTEEKLKKVLAFVDKLNSKEGYILLNYGVEGRNYTIENGNLKTKESSSNYDLLSYSEISTNWKKESHLSIDTNQFKNQLKIELNIPDKDIVIDPTAPLKIQGHIQNENKLQAQIDQLNAKFIFGQINKDEYEEGINDWLSTGGKDYIQRVNDLYKVYLNGA